MIAKIPLILRLKKQRHREIARAQDLIIEVLFEIFDKAVLHGGTAIWRCYQGNRFSEDVDAYIPKDEKKINSLFLELEKKGFKIIKKKVSENNIYSELELNRVSVRFEATFRNIKGTLKDYETAEGNIKVISSLDSQEFVKEKIETYLKRLKIRDMYDIFFLLRYIDNKQEIKKELKKFVDNFKEPIDENDLKAVIIEGLVPDSDKMLSYIKSFT